MRLVVCFNPGLVILIFSSDYQFSLMNKHFIVCLDPKVKPPT